MLRVVKMDSTRTKISELLNRDELHGLMENPSAYFMLLGLIPLCTGQLLERSVFHTKADWISSIYNMVLRQVLQLLCSFLAHSVFSVCSPYAALLKQFHVTLVSAQYQSLNRDTKPVPSLHYRNVPHLLKGTHSTGEEEIDVPSPALDIPPEEPIKHPEQPPTLILLLVLAHHRVAYVKV